MRDYYAIRFSSTLKSSLAPSITQNAAYLGSRDHSVASDGVIGRAPARTVGCSDFQGTDDMKIHVGFDMAFECPQPTPMIFMVNVHPSRAADLITLDSLRATPARLTTTYIDGFGNKCTRLLAPAGELRVTSDAIVEDSGLPDCVEIDAQEHAIADLPHDTLVFLLASRYCETDRLMEKAWELFGKSARGWRRVQAICDFVHSHMEFGYQHAGPKKGATDALTEKRGVCRDFAHLAVTFCRCMNIPARYCTGYLGDIGVPPDPDPMDFSAWFEVFLGGRWHTFDARHNTPRIGRVLVARGRDAADVAISTTFGANTLKRFAVRTDEVIAPAGPTPTNHQLVGVPHARRAAR
jgi:transglutaminase-like putative cysteine protease